MSGIRYQELGTRDQVLETRDKRLICVEQQAGILAILMKLMAI